MSRNWRWYLLGYLYLLPMTLVGLFIAKIFYKASSWKWYDGFLTCIAAPDSIWGRPNAQTLGWVVICDTEDSRNEVDLRVHEAVHIVQGFWGSLLGLVITPLICLAFGWPWLAGVILGGFMGGLGFSILYAILFVYLFVKQGTGWYWAYRNNPFEVQAYDTQDKYIADPSSKPWGV